MRTFTWFRKLLLMTAAVVACAALGTPAEAKSLDGRRVASPHDAPARPIGGHGDRGYSYGYTYRFGGRTYSQYYGWGGGPGHRRYWGGYSYNTPRSGYSYRWGW